MALNLSSACGRYTSPKAVEFRSNLPKIPNLSRRTPYLKELPWGSYRLTRASEERKSEEGAAFRMESSTKQEVVEEEPLNWSPPPPVEEPGIFLENNKSLIISNNISVDPSSTVDICRKAPTLEPTLRGNKRKKSSRSRILPVEGQDSSRDRGNNFSDPLNRDPKDSSLGPSQNSQEFGVQERMIADDYSDTRDAYLYARHVEKEGTRELPGGLPPAPIPFSKQSSLTSVGNNEFPRQGEELICLDQEERTGSPGNPLQVNSDITAPSGYVYSNKSIIYFFNANKLELDNTNNYSSNNLMLIAYQLKALEGPYDWTLRNRGPVFSSGNAGHDGVIRNAHWLNAKGEHFVTPSPYQWFDEVVGNPTQKSAVPDILDQ